MLLAEFLPDSFAALSGINIYFSKCDQNLVERILELVINVSIVNTNVFTIIRIISLKFLKERKEKSDTPVEGV